MGRRGIASGTLPSGWSSSVTVLAAVVLAVACVRPTGEPGATAPSGAMVVSTDGLTLTVVIQPDPVRRDGPVQAVATVRNDRLTAVEYSAGGCGVVDLRLMVPVPWEPVGRAWTGREGWFKEFALSSALGPGGVRADDPMELVLLADPCESAGAGAQLAPFGSLSADFGRAVEDAIRTHPYSTSLPISATFHYDPIADPSNPRMVFHKELTISGRVAVDGVASDVLSAGQAVDAILADRRFAEWLNAQPPGTCGLTNLFLTSGSPIDVGPAWDVELICETNVPRHFAIALVGAEAGEIRRLDICDPPCDR